MDSAIPQHLRVERSRHLRISGDYKPPYPSFVARFKPNVTRVVMAYFGVQHRGERTAAVGDALASIIQAFAAPAGPGHWDRAHYVDEAGYETTVTVAYWDDPAKFDQWLPVARAGWTGHGGQWRDLGVFMEVIRPSIEVYETLFSSLGRPEGVAILAQDMSDEVVEHAYWGGMRDRIPMSQTSAMDASGVPRLKKDGPRVEVVPHENLCLIRSGQDWTDTEATERRMYLEEVEPVLREGMVFLRDAGGSIGCFASRYMTVLDAAGRPTEKSYGMSWWRGLTDLERWAESHPTHLKIFGAAMRYLSKLGPNAKLRLYHEVTVARAHEQFFEYLNCHPQTGMLKAAGA